MSKKRETIAQCTYDDRGLLIRAERTDEEIVRCKDCKHYWKNNPSDDVPMCLATPKDDAFCSEGERREDETD